IHRAEWSQSALTTLEFADERTAFAAFAVLSSRLAFWLWHVKEDGFHVTRSFVSELPFPSALDIDGTAALGAKLWDDLQVNQVVSVNAGRQTVAYRPHSCGRTRDAIDNALLDALGVEPSFGLYLRAFARAVVTVDEDDSARRRFTGPFVDTDVVQ